MSDSAAHRHAKPFVYLTSRTKALHFSIAEIQSRMDIRQPDSLNLEYTRTMMGFLLFEPEPRYLAMIGLGGGSLAKFCFRHLATTNICVVEINPYVIALRNEFLVPPDGDRFSVIEGDGAEFLRFASHRFEVMLVDGYDSQGLPKGLSSQRFYDDCFETLMPNGILVVNLHFDHPLYQQHTARIRNSFKDAVLIVEDRREGNSVVFAQKGHSPAALRVGPMRRPQALDEGTWKSLQGPFSRILSSLKQQFR